MFFVLLGLWFIFNGRFSIELLCIGIVISLAICIFCWKFLNYSPKRELRFLKKLGRAFIYLITLFIEIVKANCQVIFLIFNSKLEVEPCLIEFHSKLESESARVVFANSITLTPGTFTVKLTEDDYIVHCLDRDMAFGEEESGFEKQLLKLEEKDAD